MSNAVKTIKKAVTKPHEALAALNPATAVPVAARKGAEELGRAAKDLGESMAPDINFPEPPVQADLSQASEEARRRQARRGGRASTILTSPSGAGGGASIGTKTLLGQ